MRLKRILASATAPAARVIAGIGAAALAGIGAAHAADSLLPAAAAKAAEANSEYAHPWQITMQPAATPVAVRLHELDHLVTWIAIGIAVFVLVLLAWVIIRYNARRHPTPSRTTHNTLIELLWTVIPVVILVVITIPSFKLLYYMDRTSTPDMTLKVTGHQWYWSYEYPDSKISFDSLIIPEDQLKPGQHRLLEVDNRVVVPVDTTVRVLITAGDVIHSWAVPAFGIKTDAMPGRVNETWFRVTRPGVYYGQCSELCGVNHAFMPIVVEAVSKEAYKTWVANMKKAAAADTPSDGVEVASRAASAAAGH